MLLKFAIKDFFDDVEFRNLRPESIKSYHYTLHAFHEFCVKEGVVDTGDITTSLIRSFLLHCKNDRNNNPVSLNHKLRNIKALCNYLESIDLYTSKTNPARKIPFIKEDVKIQPFTEEQVKKMLNYYQRQKRRGGEFHAYRNYAIIVTLLSTGMRLGELCNMRWTDIDWQNDIITLEGKKREQSTIPIVDKLKKELAEYRLYIEAIFDKPCEYVWTNQFNKRLTVNAAKHIFQRLAKVMNFKDVRLSAHTFRHTFAVNLVLAGADAFTVQKLLRHSSMTMTMRYVNLYGQHLHDKNDKYNPLNTMKLD